MEKIKIFFKITNLEIRSVINITGINERRL